MFCGRCVAGTRGSPVARLCPGCSMPQTILVVDDEAVARRFLERALTQAGFGVVLANDGEEALLLLRSNRHKIELVVTDLVMPGMGGHAFSLEAAALSSPPAREYFSDYERQRGEISSGFLQKPFG